MRPLRKTLSFLKTPASMPTTLTSTTQDQHEPLGHARRAKNSDTIRALGLTERERERLVALGQAIQELMEQTS